MKPALTKLGALAQLGERIAGSDEVRGSIPLGSIFNENPDPNGSGFFVLMIAITGTQTGVRTRIRTGTQTQGTPAPHFS